MNIKDFNKAKFTAGAMTLDAIPFFSLPEIAFAGRSNVGKSSLLNSITGIKKLARVSTTPGRTQQINFFEIENECILCDLPGYGYAKVSKSMQKSWANLINNYLKGRQNLLRTYLLIDSRLGYTKSDSEILDFFKFNGISFQTILTKVDKISEKELEETMKKVQHENDKYPSSYPEILIASTEKHELIDKIRNSICELINSRK